MPLSRQEISDINSTLFKVDARQKSGQQRANAQNKFASATSSFIPTNEEKEEIYKSLVLWSGMDDTAFEAIFFYHPLLARVMRWLILDLSGTTSTSSGENNNNNNNTSSSSSPTSPKHVAAALRLCIGRCLLWNPTHDPAQIQSSQDPSLFADRLDTLFPPDIVTAVALLLGKFSPLFGSIVITSWALQNPTSVASLTSFGGLWCSRIAEMNAHVAALARKGRFERTVEEITRAIGQCRTSILGTWALVHSCPSLADFFCPLPKLVATCRVIAEEICPSLQHFVFTCDRFASVRPKLVRIIQKIANATVDIATIAMMFSSHWSSSNNSTFKDYIKQYDRAISEQVRNKGGFVARVMLKGNCTGGVRETIFSFMPSSAFAIPDESDRLRCLRDAFPALEDNASSQSAKHSGRLQHSVYFAEQVLRRMCQQKIKLFPDDAPGLINNNNSSAKNEKKPAATITVASNNNNNNLNKNSAAATTSTTSSVVQDAQQQYGDLVPMVMEILPQLPRIAVLKALDYYKGNVEKIIDDAMNGNLPPHVSSDDAPAASAGGSNKNNNSNNNSTAGTSTMMSFGSVNDNNNYYDESNNNTSSNNTLTFKSVAELLNAIDEQFFTSNPNNNNNNSNNNNINRNDNTSYSSSSSTNNNNLKETNETVMQLLMGEELFALINNGGNNNDKNQLQRQQQQTRRVTINDNDDDDEDDTQQFANLASRAGAGESGMMLMSRMKSSSVSDDWSLPPIEQDLIDKTRQLMDRMYTDELDDAGLGNDMPDVRPLNNRKKGNTIASDDDVDVDEDDDEDGEADGNRRSRNIDGFQYGNNANGNEGGNNEDGSFYLNRRNAQSDAHGDTADKAKRPKHGGGGGAAAAPSYAKKPKSDWRKNETKRHQANNKAGGGGGSGGGKQNTKQILRTMAAGGN